MGYFLRKFKLDETLQLINVLRGEMSLIGPRPLMEDEVQKYFSSQDRIEYFSVKPGITGAWACLGEGGSNMAYKERIKIEIEYANNVTLIGDIRILIKTVKEISVGKGV
jgi:exopolysaccharide production protein ExoY